MDSGNSGSIQSSSGADDEYDSRAAFMIPNPPLPPPPFFDDPISSYLQLHPNWPGIRSDANVVSPSTSAAVPTFHPPPPPSATLGPQNPNPNPPGRNPKKRSRASRRAPTTVLTTDTSNFRAMVQEFTGIPAPPFDGSSFPRARLDLFGAASRSAASPYLRRPFAQKVQPPTPFSAAAAAAGASSSSASTSNLAGASTNLFQNPFLTNFLSPKFPFSDPKPGPSFQLPPSTDPRQFGNLLFSPQQNDRVIGEGGVGGGKQPESNEGMVESWICSSE